MRIGVLGAGQLGRMIALAGYPLGLEFRFLDPAAEAPAEHLADRLLGAFDDQDMLGRFADGVDLVTYEFENVPVASALFLQSRVPVYPPPAALQAAQDRLTEKQLFQSLAIPTPAFRTVDTRAELDAAVTALGLPAVLKTRSLGYDGKGQAVLRSAQDLSAAWQQLGARPLLLEAFVSFQRELSVLAVRSRSGSTCFYPLVENHHRGGILRMSVAPAPQCPAKLQELAEGYASQVLDALDYVGVLAIELFQTEHGLLANEIAPRVHNSGHWTIEGAETSQFENHLRALLDLPLGSTAAVGHSAMLNLIGCVPPSAALLAVPGAHLHLYGKAARPARKLGHVTVCAATPKPLRQRVRQLQAIVGAAADQ